MLHYLSSGSLGTRLFSCCMCKQQKLRKTSHSLVCIFLPFLFEYVGILLTFPLLSQPFLGLDATFQCSRLALCLVDCMFVCHEFSKGQSSDGQTYRTRGAEPLHCRDQTLFSPAVNSFGDQSVSGGDNSTPVTTVESHLHWDQRVFRYLEIR